MKLNDGLTSLATNLGKRQASTHYETQNFLTYDISQLEALWKESWVAQKICRKKAQDMTRKWREITSNDLDGAQLEKIDRLERKLKLKETLEQALIWASLYGGVGILVLTEKSTMTPLTADQAIDRLVLLRKDMVVGVGSLNNNIFDENYGKFDQYKINSLLDVHHSRLIIINGTPRPPKRFADSEIWGLSDLEAVYSTLKRFDLLSTNTGDLVNESKVDVLKMEGLTERIAAGMEEQIAKAVSMVQLIKSSTNTLLLDKENEYEQKELSFSGLRDLLVEFRNAVAGAADMPVTILFGQSAAGFASGAEDIQNYHESIHALQESRLRPVFDRLDPILCQMALGFEPADFWFEFNSLQEMSIEQKITSLNSFATATNVLIERGVLTEQQVANELKESGLFNSISTEDVKAITVESEF
ncbi:anti-CBASS protein Acb1 family protein [Haemophilus sputorum]|uniref:anti-CBASS protein Acb1 family protein n=1 Tax=Haemophilus sputorum TaxID=1078480 RepID=UPI0028D5EF54|nr:anti-CBASS Acb1 family protein [Haemophilus sputorum]